MPARPAILARHIKRGEMVDISNLPTCALVEELQRRDGVKTEIADPYQDVDIKVNGPSIVLVVID